MGHIFVSYKREDASRVEPLVIALREKGYATWWDRDIPPNAPWEKTIEAKLQEANAVMVCWSPLSVASDNVKAEARKAYREHRLLQIFIEPCEPPLFFGERQGVNLFNWRGDLLAPQFEALEQGIRHLLDGQGHSHEKHNESIPKKKPSRLSNKLVFLFGLVPVAAGGGYVAISNCTDLESLNTDVFESVNAARDSEKRALDAQKQAREAAAKAEKAALLAGNGGAGTMVKEYQPQYQYAGEWSNEQQNGYGILTVLSGNYYSGDRYAGEWKNGQRQGYGVNVFAENEGNPGGNSIKLEGEYQSLGSGGYGVWTWKSGRQLRGGIHGYKTGVVLINDELRYEGELKDGLPAGRGVLWSKAGYRKFLAKGGCLIKSGMWKAGDL